MVGLVEGDEFTARCESIGEKGDGVFLVRGFVVFVSGAVVGREYRVLLTKLKDDFGFGRVVEELESGESGCDFQSSSSG